MNILTLHTLPQSLPVVPRRVALGIFDGLHIGHRTVLSHTLDGEERPAVLTLTHTKKAACPLLTEEEESEKLAQIGIEDWILADLELVKELTPAQFVDTVLRDTLHATAVCCGYNYHFGKDRVGNVKTLQKLCAARGIAVTVVPPVKVDGKIVSSTRIRRLITAGDMDTAARLLGYPYTLKATVEHGHRLGSKLGFPTINQIFPENRLMPQKGVYVSAVLAEGKMTFGVTNVGCRPTVHTTPVPLAETWLPDFSGDLYGKTVEVSLLRFLRPEQSFDSLEALTAEVRKNGEEARRQLVGDPADTSVKAVLFDFDDTLQNRRIAFETFAYELLCTFFPDWDDALRHERAHRMMVENNGGYTAGYKAYFMPYLREWEWPEGVDVDRLLDITNRRFPEYVHLFDDVVPTLKALRRRGYRLGIVTNGNSQMQNRKIEMAGLRPLVDLVLVSGDEGVHKPDGELFRRAAYKLGVPPQNCLYVGDYPQNDIVGAQNGGMKPLYIDVFGQNAADKAIPRITALSQVLPYLNKKV